MMDSPYAMPALMQTGGQVVSGVAQSRAEKQQREREEEREAEERRLYNHNMGTRLWRQGA
jgi:hypothetical protein